MEGQRGEATVRLFGPGGQRPASPGDALGALGFATQPDGEKCLVHETYFDTHDRWLFRAGAACVLREQRGAAALRIVPLSTQAELPVPGEWAQERTDDTPFEESRTAERLKSVLGGRDLAPQAEVVVETERWRLSAPDGFQARLEARAIRPAGDAGAGWFEVHLGASAARAKPLAKLAADLASRWGLSTDGPSAQCAVLESRTLPPRRLVEGDDLVLQLGDTARGAMVRVFRRQLGRMVWNEPGARLGLDAAYLHDMRVAARRMRAALRIFGDALPPRRVAWLKRELRRLGATLGAVRDLDVSLLNLRGERDRLDPDLQPGMDVYLEELACRREKARRAMLRALDAARYAQFVERLTCFLDAPAPKRLPVPAREPAPALAARTIRKALRKVRKKGRALATDAPDEELHRLRIACKRLRYACEFFTDLLGKPAADFAARVKEVQDVLGAHQDAVVARSLLMEHSREMSAAPRGFSEGPGAPADRRRRLYLALGVLMARHDARAEETRTRFFRLWKRFDRAKVRKPLKNALASPSRGPGPSPLPSREGKGRESPLPPGGG